MTVTRRAVLGAAALAGFGVLAGRSPASAAPVTEERRRAVVVGTGFGGGVAAARLARAGVPALVLERGRRWPVRADGETFPHLFSPDRRAAWLSPVPVAPGPPALWQPYVGVLDRVRGVGMDILCGAGVGGGSLVYHGMTLQPDAATFAASMPPELDFELFDRDHYRRAAAVLRPATIPDDVLAHERYRSSRMFLARAEAAGTPGFRVPLPIDWDVPRRELRGELRPSYTHGDVVYGANNGGKNTVDRTWVAEAERSRLVEVAPLHRVADVERDRSGRWVVHAERIDEDGTVLARRRVVTDALFLAAGSAGTTRLLVKAKAKGLVADLPDGVGRRWGNNGDRIYAWAPAGESPGALQGGPACVGVRDWTNPAGALTVISAGVPFPATSGSPR